MISAAGLSNDEWENPGDELEVQESIVRTVKFARLGYAEQGS